LLNYYVQIAPILLPHLKNRPVTMKRFPDGVAGFSFYEKHCPTHRPGWLETAVIVGTETPQGVRFCLINDIASLAWTAQLANVELHTTLARAAAMEQPTFVVFDLDPGEPAGVLECAQTAVWLREYILRAGLESFVKTSGSKGLQLYVPLNRSATYDAVKPFARGVAQALEKEHSEKIVSQMSKALRRAKVFIDWSQNNRHKTTICVYSMRGRDRPSVSTPLSWDELESGLRAGDAARFSFGPEDVLHRVEEHGDLFAPVLKMRQAIPKSHEAS
jgi:bifunctional non-homologous end joining protein LigD